MPRLLGFVVVPTKVDAVSSYVGPGYCYTTSGNPTRLFQHALAAADYITLNSLKSGSLFHCYGVNSSSGISSLNQLERHRFWLCLCLTASRTGQTVPAGRFKWPCRIAFCVWKDRRQSKQAGLATPVVGVVNKQDSFNPFQPRPTNCQ